MSLVLAPTNHNLTITKLIMEEDTKHYLESLGISYGTSIVVLQTIGGNLICKIKDYRIALDKDLCRKIYVNLEGTC